MRYWRDQVVAGLRITDLGALLYGSDELYTIVGSTDRAFLDRLYLDLLHRAPDDSGMGHWLGALRTGTSRVAVAGAFYGSVESRRDRVRASYGAVLGRPPDASGLDHWAAALLRVDDVALAAHLAASDEFFGAAQR